MYRSLTFMSPYPSTLIISESTELSDGDKYNRPLCLLLIALFAFGLILLKYKLPPFSIPLYEDDSPTEELDWLSGQTVFSSVGVTTKTCSNSVVVSSFDLEDVSIVIDICVLPKLQNILNCIPGLNLMTYTFMF